MATVNRIERAGAVVLMLVALGRIAGSGPGNAAETLRMTIGVVGDIGSIDPAEGTSGVAREIWRLQYRTPTELSVDSLSPVPGIAESWTVSADRREVTYTIASGATWSDGTPVTADDVVYSLDRARDERWPYAAGAFDGLTARALDDRTVAVSTGGDPGALPTLLLHVVPRHVFERATDVGATGVVGNGDWRVTERTDGDVRLTVVDRPGRPALDEIIYRTFPDTSALLDALGRGEVDVAAGLDPADLEAARAVAGATVVHANDGDQWLLRVRLPDRALRRTISRAIDRDRLVRDARAGVGRAQVVPVVARDHAWSPDDESMDAVAKDVGFRASARTLLAGERLTLAFDHSDEDASIVAAAVAKQLRAAGATVETRDSGAADLALVRRDPGDDPAPALAPYTCAGGVWCDPAFDDAFEQLAGSDPARRLDAVHRMTEQLATEAVEIVLFAPDELQAFRGDHVFGLLREPSDERLVALWPSTLHYKEVVRAAPPAGEEVPTNLFVALAIAVGVVAAAGAVVVTRRVRSHGPAFDRDVARAAGRDGLAPERRGRRWCAHRRFRVRTRSRGNG